MCFTDFQMYFHPSIQYTEIRLHLCVHHTSCINELELGIVPFTNRNIACSDGSFIRILNTNINWSFDICREYDM